MSLLILSDIHGNLSALNAVLEKAEKEHNIDAVAILGDIIDYGMRSNEVAAKLQSLELPTLCNIWGNHEYSIINKDFKRFSSQRGVESAKNTEKHLSTASYAYLKNLEGQNGVYEFSYNGLSFLAVHGSLSDTFWEAISPEMSADQAEQYKKYDYVLSGHNHIPHIFSRFYTCYNEKYRNKKRTVFINPGSVGQPRNHNSRAQYAVIEKDSTAHLYGVEYDIEAEQKLFDGSVDDFYKTRLSLGV